MMNRRASTALRGGLTATPRITSTAETQTPLHRKQCRRERADRQQQCSAATFVFDVPQEGTIVVTLKRAAMVVPTVDIQITPSP
jgi:hypothetical protein